MASGEGSKNIFKTMFNKTSSSSVVSESTIQHTIDLLALYKRKAIETRNIVDTFKYLSVIWELVVQCGGTKTIAKTSWKRANPKVWQQFQSDIFTWTLMMVFHKQEFKHKSWSLLFYEYMVNGLSKKWNILTPESVVHYSDLLNLTLDYLPPDVRETAEDITRFFEWHQYDPYSSVIGQRPSKEIVQFSLHISDSSLKENSKLDLFTLDAANPAPKTRNKKFYKSKYRGILTRIVQWSTLSANDCFREVKQTASSIRGVERLSSGSLVLIKVPEDLKIKSLEEEKWVYARVAGKADGSLILVYLDPHESNVSSFPYDRVIPVPTELLQKHFLKDNHTELEKCVEHSTDIVYHHLVNHCSEGIRKFVEGSGLPTEVLQLASKSQCSLGHVNELRKISAFLEKPIPANLQNQIEKYVTTTVQEHLTFISKLPPYLLFQPTLDQTINSLKEFDCKVATRQELKKYQGYCELAMGVIMIEKTNILNGNRKNEIVTEWLKKIDIQVVKLLRTNGFDSDAVPSNYIDAPPANVSTVRRNLVLLRKVLKTTKGNNDIYQLQKLISDICATTYQTIDLFLQDMRICISEYANIPVQQAISMTPAQLIEELNKRSNIGSDIRSGLIGVARDIQYLIDMKRMEGDQKYANSRRMEIVPISGLVLSKLCRMENEHKTVLDLWEPAKIAKSLEDSRTPLESAVIKSDIKQVASILKSGMAYINEQDANGWTSLHLSCSYCFNDPRLEVTEYLLAIPDIDSTILNNYGNTALHYFARIPVTSDIQHKYRNILLNFVSSKDMLFQQNLKGETPLHHSALSSNPVAVRLLLESNADPNSPTHDGLTPLHCAVQSTNKECVEILTKFGANPFFSANKENKRGDSPLDLAIKLNLTEICKILSTTEWTDDKSKQDKELVQKRRIFAQKSNNYRRTIYQDKVPEQVLQMAKIIEPAKSESFAAFVDGAGESPVSSDNKKESVSLSSSWMKKIKPMKNAVQKMASDVAKAGAELSKSLPSGEAIESKFNHDKRKSVKNINPDLNEVIKNRNPPPGFSSAPITLPTSQTTSPNTVSSSPSLPLPSPSLAGESEFRIALWDASADSADELNFKKNDVIKVISTDASGWWIGEVHGKMGSFPANYTAPHNGSSAPSPNTPPSSINASPAPQNVSPKKLSNVNAGAPTNSQKPKGPQKTLSQSNLVSPKPANFQGSKLTQQLQSSDKLAAPGSPPTKQLSHTNSQSIPVAPLSLGTSPNKGRCASLKIPKSSTQLAELRSDINAKLPTKSSLTSAHNAGQPSNQPNTQPSNAKLIVDFTTEDDTLIQKGTVVKLIKRDPDEPGWIVSHAAGFPSVTIPDNKLEIVGSILKKSDSVRVKPSTESAGRPLPQPGEGTVRPLPEVSSSGRPLPQPGEQAGGRPLPQPTEQAGGRPLPQPGEQAGGRPLPQPAEQAGGRPLPQPGAGRGKAK